MWKLESSSFSNSAAISNKQLVMTIASIKLIKQVSIINTLNFIKTEIDLGEMKWKTKV